MATFTLNRADVFPESTSVGAYPTTNWSFPSLPPRGAAVGSPTASATVTSGVASFSGLTSGTAYYFGASVSGTWRYVYGTTDPIVVGGVQAVNSVNGQTGAVSLAKADVGLGNVDNTTDANKPVSTATTAAIAAATPDAGATTKGKIQLAGDLGGVATSPTVPGLTGKQPRATVVSKTAAYTAAAYEVVEVDASGGAVTITSPTSPVSGDQFWVKKTDASANAVTVTGTLDATTSPALTYQWGSLWLVYDGSKWVRPDRHALGSLVGVSLGTPTDGQCLVYQASSGTWIPGAPATAGREIAYAENVTGTTTTASVVGAATGTAVDIPSCAISVPANTGAVYIEGQVYLQQTVVGIGTVFVKIVETTSGTVDFEYEGKPLINTNGTQTKTIGAIRPRRRIGAVASTRTFKLQVAVAAPASNSPSVVAINAAWFESYLHAWAE